MDISAVIVIVLLTALALAAIIWMQIQSRKADQYERPGDTNS